MSFRARITAIMILLAKSLLAISFIAGLAMLVLAAGVLSYAALTDDGQAAVRGVWWMIGMASAALMANIAGWLILWGSAHRRRAKLGRARSVVLLAPVGPGFPAEYARSCFDDCTVRGETPLVRHFRDHAMAIESGTSATVVYVDLGVTPAMHHGVALAVEDGHSIELRQLPGWGPTAR